MMLIKKLNSSNCTENMILEVSILSNAIKTPLILQHFKDLLIKHKAKASSSALFYLKKLSCLFIPCLSMVKRIKLR